MPADHASDSPSPLAAPARHRPFPIRAGLALLRWTAALVVALVLLEIGARVAGLGVPPRGPNNRLPIRTLVAPDKAPRLYDTLKPSTSGEVLYPGFGDVPDRTVHYAINRDGFRDRAESYARPKPQGVFRIAVLGDSVTYGTGVELEDSLPKVMERRFAAAGLDCRVEVMNCGVFAHNTSQQVAWFEFNVARFEPDLVLLVSTIPDASGRNIEAAPGRSDEPSERAQWIERLGLTSGVWDAGETEGLTPARARTMALRRRSVLVDMIAHRLHGWLRGGLMYESYKLDWSEGSPGREMVGRSLDRLVTLSREQGFDLVGSMYPTLVQLDEHYPFAEEARTLGAMCAERGVPFFDLLEPLLGQDGKSLQVHPHDRHPNARCHAIVGDYLAHELIPRVCTE
ncbi:SGNH/GDSL hydrolase family protein [Engelhardtia mirabilis]|uniref:SGNH hydrolase-type esterase domain-containing protein n=1 Tax=Engelhardtia mirabilis TaxID=2528011 RepID=A0A518BP20_9BACT|nr:hypothetical protein Pla133_37860 [Planctomycetes bacterium Pla133]QDV03010.1 hypothetical protein Pla86_37850 [Planctomycetes bacterium Pla86]